MMIDIENMGDSLKISHFDQEGDIAYFNLNIPPEERYSWEKCKANDRFRDKEFTNWDGSPVKKVYGKKLDRYRIQQILNDSDKEKTKVLWEYQRPKKYFVDIEVEITDNAVDSLDTENAPNRILSIGIATDNNKLIVLGLDDLGYDEILLIEKKINEYLGSQGDVWTFKYMKFESEYDMLYTFLGKLCKKMGLITGWNWFGYDWPYIYNRCAKLGINPAIISPSKVLKGKNKSPQHLLMIDYLDIYKKFDRVVKIKENNKLDYVSEQVLGLKKIEYTGTLRDLYQSSFVDFIYYNAIDCALLRYIDKKITTMDTFFKIALVTGSEIDRTLSPVWTTEIMMLRKFTERGKIFVEERKDSVAEKFAGAFVKTPQIGFHEYVTCFDFASLYPNTMVQWCISPETYKGKNLSSPKPEWIKTASGAYFGGIDDDPIIRGIIVDLYSRRKERKKIMMEKKMEIDHLKKELKRL